MRRSLLGSEETPERKGFRKGDRLKATGANNGPTPAGGEQSQDFSGEKRQKKIATDLFGESLEGSFEDPDMYSSREEERDVSRILMRTGWNRLPELTAWAKKAAGCRNRAASRRSQTDGPGRPLRFRQII